MQDNLIKKICPSIRIIINIILIIILLIARSIFLNLVLTILVLILLILSDFDIKIYLNLIKKFIPWLIFVFLTYIIIYVDILGALILLYKFILIIIVFRMFTFSMNFNDLNSGVYTIISPLNRLGLDSSTISFNITLYIYYLIYLSNSGNKIIKSQTINNKVKYNVRHLLIPSLILSNNNINELKDYLKLNFYNVKKENINFKSKLLLSLFVVLLVISVFKEVVI